MWIFNIKPKKTEVTCQYASESQECRLINELRWLQDKYEKIDLAHLKKSAIAVYLEVSEDKNIQINLDNPVNVAAYTVIEQFAFLPSYEQSKMLDALTKLNSKVVTAQWLYSKIKEIKEKLGIK